MPGWLERIRALWAGLWGRREGMPEAQPQLVERPPVEEPRLAPSESSSKPEVDEDLWWYDEELIRRIIERVKRL